MRCSVVRFVIILPSGQRFVTFLTRVALALFFAVNSTENDFMENRENTKVSYALKRELKGGLYREVLEYSLLHCASAVVVVRSHISLSENAKSFLRRVEPFLLGDEAESPWLGAQLFDAQSHFKRFVLSPESLQIVFDFSKKLYEWEQPVLPEDFSLFRANGQDWLVTMSHTRQAYLSLTREERAAIVVAIPKLASFFSGSVY
jgi:hypothetical protein